MSAIEFQPWPKIARLNRDVTITEKLDGTNAAIVIVEVPFGRGTFPDYNRIAIVVDETRLGNDALPDFEYHVYAQSRNRFITPEKDNYGFAGWVKRNVEALVATLGAGTHFGEWWGSGIQRGYGLTGGEKRFSLFNTGRWGGGVPVPPDQYPIVGLGVVPVIYRGTFGETPIQNCLHVLEQYGSIAAPGFTRPEGIVIRHEAARQSFKVTLENDAAPAKGIRNPLDLLPIGAAA